MCLFSGATGVGPICVTVRDGWHVLCPAGADCDAVGKDQLTDVGVLAPSGRCSPEGDAKPSRSASAWRSLCRVPWSVMRGAIGGILINTLAVGSSVRELDVDVAGFVIGNSSSTAPHPSFKLLVSAI